MELAERWSPIPDFPMYSVSNHGRVMNNNTEHLKIPSANQQGIPSVLLVRDGRQYRRTVALLVANAFLPPVRNRPAFDTPINLDGDRFNNHVNNLAWRPNWFAVRYHAQLKLGNPYGFRGAVRIADTDETFQDVRDAAVMYGLLMRDIILCMHNRTLVFPHWFTFEAVTE